MNVISDALEILDLYTVLDNIGHPVTSRKYYSALNCDLEVWDFVCQAIVNHTDPDWHAYSFFSDNEMEEICQLSVSIVSKVAGYVGASPSNIKVQSAMTYDLNGSILLKIKKLGNN